MKNLSNDVSARKLFCEIYKEDSHKVTPWRQIVTLESTQLFYKEK